MGIDIEEQLNNSQSINRVLVDVCKNQNKKVKRLIVLNIIQFIIIFSLLITIVIKNF